MTADPDPADPAPLDRVGLLAAAGAAVAWGTAGVFVRRLPTLSSWEIVGGRSAVGLLVAGGLVLATGRRARRWGFGRGPHAPLLGVVMTAYYLVAVAAFQRTTVAEGALLMCVSPLFALGFDLATGAAVPARRRRGAVVAVAGLGVMLWPKLTGGADAGRLLGSGLALLAAAVMAGYSVLYRRAAPADAPTPAAAGAATFALGTAGVGLFLLAWGELADAVDKLTPAAAANVAGLGVVGTAVPTVLYSAASARLPAVVATSVRLLSPLAAAGFAAAALGEAPHPLFWPGAAVTLMGLRLVTA